jgi:hypothetical protein
LVTPAAFVVDSALDANSTNTGLFSLVVDDDSDFFSLAVADDTGFFSLVEIVEDDSGFFSLVDVDSAFLSAVSVLDASSTKTGFASAFFSAVFSVGLESLATTFELDSVVFSAGFSTDSVFFANSINTGFSAAFSDGLESLETTFELNSVAFTAGFSMDSAFFSASLFGSYRVMSPLISGFFTVYGKKC